MPQYTSGSIPGWLSASQAGYKFGRGLGLDQALGQAANAPDESAVPPAATNTAPTNIGLADASAGDPTAAPAPNAVAPAPTAAAPAPSAKPSPETVAARQRAIYSAYGENDQADKMAQSQAQLGLTNAQTAQVQQGTANAVTQGKTDAIDLKSKSRVEESAAKVQSVKDQVTASLQNLKDPQGNPRAPTAEEALANQRDLVTQLYASGQTDAAGAALKTLKGSVTDRIDADASIRKQAANTTYMQVTNGDYSGVPKFIKQFSYGMSTNSIDNIAPGPQPGTLSLTFTDQEGQKTKVVPEAAFRKQMLEQFKLQSSDNAAVAKQAGDHLEAQIYQERATGDAAKERGAYFHGRGAAENAASARKGKVFDARTRLGTPGATQDPADVGLVNAANGEAASKFRPLANQDAQQALRAATQERVATQGQINSLTNQLLGANSAPNPANPGGVSDRQRIQSQIATYQAKQDALVKSLSNMRAGLSSADPSMDTSGATGAPGAKAAAPLAPSDPSQRKVGQSYSNGRGQTGVWTGNGWTPQ